MTVTIETIKATNLLAGKYFFSKGATSFFHSRVLPTVYGEKYFITSEVDPSGSKRYSIREALSGGADIKTVGKFHSFITEYDARKGVRRLLAGVEVSA